MGTSHRAVALLSLAAVFALTACSPGGLPEFDREQVAADRPDTITAVSGDGIDVASLRHVGDAEGYEVYLARGAEDREILCLALVRDDAWESTHCGMQAVSVEVAPGVRIATNTFRPGGEVREPISESVWISRK